MISKKYIVFVFLFILFSSCTKEFLDVNNTQQLFRESYVKDLTSMQEYVRGATYNLNRFVESGEAVVTYPELVADNLRPLSTTSAASTAPFYNWTLKATGGLNMNGFWTNSYLVIRMCNFVIEETDQYRGENPTKADDIKGQALAIRALLYFKLVNVFAQPYTYTTDASHAGVPYITSSDITDPYTRQTVAQVYAGMITDLTSAIQILPSAVSDVRYMNRNAAKALLARIYLFKEDFVNAKTLATEVANQVPLMTIGAGYPGDMFKFRLPAATETLFQLSPTSNVNNFIGRYVRRTPVNYIATSDIAGLLTENPNDIRRNWIQDSTAGSTTIRLIRKYPASAAPEAVPLVTIPENAYYPALLRSSEMFLTAAEAAARTNDETAAKTYLNAIRKRADPFVVDVTATGPALLDSIYKERRKELAFEGLRLFDLQRWKKGVSRADALPGAPVSLLYPANKAIAPVPAAEVQLSGISQNAGY